MTIKTNPFAAGFNRPPELFVGRDTELTVFRKFLVQLGNGTPADQAIVLYGPRGNGKTSLLRVVEQRRNSFCQDRSGVEQINVVVTNPTQIKQLGLHSVLCGRRLLDQVTHRRRHQAGTKSIFGGEGERSSTFTSNQTIYEAFMSVLPMTPILLCIDEAHTSDTESMDSIVSAFQTVAGANLPIGLVLSGTPQLPAFLDSLSASFVGRSKYIRLERLDNRSTELALRRPLEDSGFHIDNDQAFREVLDETQNYPYFVQLYGRLFWDNLADTDSTRIDQDVIMAVREQFMDERDTMYQGRFREIQKADLVDAAEVIADMFMHQESVLHSNDMESALRERLNIVDARDTISALQGLGYVWQTASVELYEPGIPSLMSYILKTREANRKFLQKDIQNKE